MGIDDTLAGIQAELARLHPPQAFSAAHQPDTFIVDTHRDIRWIILCEGGFSSSLAAYSLCQIGLSKGTDVIGGFQAWQAAGPPVIHPEIVQRGRMSGQAHCR